MAWNGHPYQVGCRGSDAGLELKRRMAGVFSWLTDCLLFRGAGVNDDSR